jgi:hypothetical protein
LTILSWLTFIEVRAVLLLVLEEALTFLFFPDWGRVLSLRCDWSSDFGSSRFLL